MSMCQVSNLLYVPVPVQQSPEVAVGAVKGEEDEGQSTVPKKKKKKKSKKKPKKSATTSVDCKGQGVTESVLPPGPEIIAAPPLPPVPPTHEHPQSSNSIASPSDEKKKKPPSEPARERKGFWSKLSKEEKKEEDDDTVPRENWGVRMKERTRMYMRQMIGTKGSLQPMRWETFLKVRLYHGSFASIQLTRFRS